MTRGGGARFPVSSEKAAALERRLLALGIREQDLDERFVQSGGKGGQNVNKVATCVLLSHGPTGTQIKCQKARTQGLNRYLARQLLADRIESATLGARAEREQAAERIRRQKRRRSRRSKLKMLAEKHAVSHKKALRAPPGRED